MAGDDSKAVMGARARLAYRICLGYLFSVVAFTAAMISGAPFFVYIENVGFYIWIAQWVVALVALPGVLLLRSSEYPRMLTAVFVCVPLAGLLAGLYSHIFYPIDSLVSPEWPSPYSESKEMIRQIVVGVRIVGMVMFCLVFLLRFPKARWIALVLGTLALPPQPWIFHSPDNPEYIEMVDRLIEENEARDAYLDRLPRFETEREARRNGVEDYILTAGGDEMRVYRDENGKLAYKTRQSYNSSYVISLPQWSIFFAFVVYCYLPFTWVQRFQRRVGIA